MCGRFTVVDDCDLDRTVHAIEEGAWGQTRETSAEKSGCNRRDVRPTAIVQVLAKTGLIVSKPMIWGFSAPWQRSPIFNARVEKAGDPDSMWHEAFTKHRCIIPAWAFFEPHRSETARSSQTGRTIKRQYSFSSPNGTPLLLAGIYDRDLAPDANGTESIEPPRFSVVTTFPIDEVKPIHDRMPLVLDPIEARAWLQGVPAASFADRSRIEFSIHPDASAFPSRDPSDADQMRLFDLE